MKIALLFSLVAGLLILSMNGPCFAQYGGYYYPGYQAAPGSGPYGAVYPNSPLYWRLRPNQRVYQRWNNHNRMLDQELNMRSPIDQQLDPESDLQYMLRTF